MREITVIVWACSIGDIEAHHKHENFKRSMLRKSEICGEIRD